MARGGGWAQDTADAKALSRKDPLRAWMGTIKMAIKVRAQVR